MKKDEVYTCSMTKYLVVLLVIFLIGCLITGIMETTALPIVFGLVLGYIVSNVLFIWDQKRLKIYIDSHKDYKPTVRERLIFFIISFWMLPPAVIILLVYLASKYIHE